MGIQGLLPLLKAIQRPARIEEFAGCTVAVDSYCWLHRGVYGCSKEIIEGKATRMYVNYCMKRIEMLINFNVKPIMVFDGGHLPSKMQKEEERKLNRQFNKSKGIEYLRQDKYIDALDCFRRAVDITPAMALELIKARLELIQNLECRKKDIECIVAPYEADAQLAYLSKAGLVDAVITEDSDLLVFGCKKVLFKLDPNGRGIEIRLDRLREVKDIDLNGVDHEAFRHICILSGCDYLPSIPGMGLKTAYKIMKRNRMKVYSAIKYIRRQNTMKVPKNYETQFKMADETFLYQVVFDPVTKTTIPLTPYPKDIEPSTLEHAGQLLTKEKAISIAYGNIDPITGEILNDYDPLKQESNASIDPKIFKANENNTNFKRKKRHSYPIQSVLSKYMKLQSPPAKLKSQFQLPRTKSLPIVENKENIPETDDETMEDASPPKVRRALTDSFANENISKEKVLQPIHSEPSSWHGSKYFKRNSSSDDVTKGHKEQTHILYTFRQKRQIALDNSKTSTSSNVNVAETTIVEESFKKSDEVNGSVDSGIADIDGSDLSDEDKEQQKSNLDETPVMVCDKLETLKCDKSLDDKETYETLSNTAMTEITTIKVVDINSSPEKLDTFADSLKAFHWNKDSSLNKDNGKFSTERLITDFTVRQVKTTENASALSTLATYANNKCRVSGLRRVSSKKRMNLRLKRPDHVDKASGKKVVQTKLNLQSYIYKKSN